MEPEARIAAPVGQSRRTARSLLHNRLSYLGLFLALLSAVLLGFLLIIEFNTGRTSPYIGIVSYLALPAALVFSLLLVPIGMGLENRRRRSMAAIGSGEAPPPFPRIDLNQPRHQLLFVLWVGATVVLLMMMGTVTYRGYAFVDSAGFCAGTCHQVMRPEAVAHKDSPHSRVSCTACHIGPGASWFVRSKLAGVGQVIAVLRSSYPRPISTPIEHLRPARETCEECHWPEKFYGDQMVTRPHFVGDEQNTDRSVSVVVKTGGGSARTGISMGIHWHMDVRNEIRYVATDRRRQTIPWVSATGPDGVTTEFFSTDYPLAKATLAGVEKREMDCLDCHNRPTHTYQMPDQAIDTAIAAGKIDRHLPFVKKIALDLVTADFTTESEARQRIANGMVEFYRTNYPRLVIDQGEAIRRSAQGAEEVWARNVFPEMKISWGSYPDNIGHRNSPGCFRCHDGKHVSKDGTTIRQDCNVCHSLPVPSAATVRDLAVETGQPAVPNSQPNWESIAKGLHQSTGHKAFPCNGCHSPTGWEIQGRDTCLACHQDRVQHNPGPACHNCHAFKQ